MDRRCGSWLGVASRQGPGTMRARRGYRWIVANSQLGRVSARSGGPLARRHDAFPAQPIRPNAGSAWRNFLHVDAVVSQDSVQYETRMNLMREQYFRRNCAQHTISVASALFGECRTRGERRIRRTLRPHRAHAGVVSRGVCGNAHLLLCLRMGNRDGVPAHHAQRLQRGASGRRGTDACWRAADCRRGQPS